MQPWAREHQPAIFTKKIQYRDYTPNFEAIFYNQEAEERRGKQEERPYKPERFYAPLRECKHMYESLLRLVENVEQHKQEWLVEDDGSEVKGYWNEPEVGKG